MDENENTIKDFVTLARLALTADRGDIEKYVRRVMRRERRANPAFADELGLLFSTAPSTMSPLRDAGSAILPVDRDTRLQLLRHEDPVILDHEPILETAVASALNLVLEERRQIGRLTENDLKPARTLLFTGKPGVGKTLTARWLASKLGKPLLTLDLSTVISSFLGRTGANLRHVLDYAKSIDSVLLLDEFDAIAKRRGDDAELGELKRLVTVILQEIDLWPSNRLLIAATNHGELLDRAVWRRFDVVLDFPLPGTPDIRKAVDLYFSDQDVALGKWRDFLLNYFGGRSVSEIERFANQIRRRMVISDTPLEDAIIEALQTDMSHLPLKQRKAAGAFLLEKGLSAHRTSRATGLARDTLRDMKRKRSSSPKGKG